jgi:hypothetical protein
MTTELERVVATLKANAHVVRYRCASALAEAIDGQRVRCAF